MHLFLYIINYMRLKNQAVMILILSAMLLGAFTGGLLKAGNKDLKPVNDDIVTPDVDPGRIPESFCASFDDPYGVPEEIRKLITDYMDAYYLSIYSLEKRDTSVYFDDERSAAISDKAIQLLCEVRKLYDYDFRMTKAHYDLKVTRYVEEGGIYYVDLLEDDQMSFVFIPGITSSAYEIENYFVIRKNEDAFKIHELEKVQGYYMMFHDSCETIEDVEKTYDYYYHELKDMISYNSDVLSRKPLSTSSKTYTNHYDRSNAVAYLDKYYHERNPEWFNYTSTGGNCQNYASQALLAGSIPMDHYGDEQWKCYISDGSYDAEIDESEAAYGRSRSWVSVGYFYDYARDNTGSGLVAEVNANIHSAEPGDIIIVGNGALSHTVMISKIIDGHILVDSNSIDMHDFPLDAYTYTNVILIKILGYNQY